MEENDFLIEKGGSKSYLDVTYILLLGFHRILIWPDIQPKFFVGYLAE